MFDDLSNAWYRPVIEIVGMAQSELQAVCSSGGTGFIELTQAEIDALLEGKALVIYRDFDDHILLRLAREEPPKC